MGLPGASEVCPLDDKQLRNDALDYHSSAPAGKITVVPTKPHGTQRELSLAYSPGVAYPCEEIQANPDDAYKYTSKGNLVAVVSNGTAVLGLGDIGALAGKPVMEGKGLLFKAFADINVFDIEVDRVDVDQFVEAVKAIAPTFGGINLEDIKAPECFEIERRLVQELDIPVMHDDQHGTAIISGAALINGLEIVEKGVGEVKVVILGAGASAISCARHYVRLGVDSQNLIMVDSRGIITTKRRDNGDLNEYKAEFAREIEDGDIASAIEGADIFLGLSKGGLLTPEMVEKMAERPLIFALANPDPEITPEEVLSVREDAIVATGRSDYPNQINNVLGFPYIFRGALDVRATEITEGMKMAATKALAHLAKEPVPDDVLSAYGSEQMQFGPNYLIPKPFDARILIWEASAVAEAAVNEGVSHLSPDEFDADSTQHSDSDGDGYGDNKSGNMGDECPGEPGTSQKAIYWNEGTSTWDDIAWYGCQDNDGDEYANTGEAFPNDPTQHADTDGDGFDRNNEESSCGDNPNGNNPDLFPTDGTQCEDRDGDGYGDNPSGPNGDWFPDDPSQWWDTDGDGLSDG